MLHANAHLLLVKALSTPNSNTSPSFACGTSQPTTQSLLLALLLPVHRP
jgi:hypothetical protein